MAFRELLVMKKYIVILIVLAVLLGGYLIFNIFCPKIKIGAVTASIAYVYEDKNINSTLSADESEFLKKIFNNKRLNCDNCDNPSCGFSEEIAVYFDNLVFCVARDNCAVIKCENRYFGISGEERKEINKIFEKYGGTFPCV
jgi:hypothetical protein